MGNLESSAALFTSSHESYDNIQISNDLRILTDANTSQEERREPFLRLWNKFISSNKQTDQEYAKEVSRVFSLRYPIWNNVPPYAPVVTSTSAPATRRISQQHRLSNAIRGCIYGAALGDAMGIATEFLSKETVVSHYGPDCDFIPGLSTKSSSSCNIYADIHRLSFIPGDWTDDTDHLILTLQSLLETGGIVDPTNFASKLLQWVECGFPELGDESGTGLGQTTKRVVRSRGYITDPINVAKDVWISGGKKSAPNGALMRTAIVGIVSFWDLDVVQRNAVTLCQATHADPRCVASCVAISCIIARILQAIDSVDVDEGGNDGTDANAEDGHEEINIDIEAIVNESITRALSIACCTKEQEDEFQKMISVDNVSELTLDCSKGMGYTFRCAACAIVMLKRAAKKPWQQQKNQEQQEQHQPSLSFLDAIKEVVMEGGDADTNGTVVGALVGCLRGYTHIDTIPGGRFISAMPNVAWLEAWTQKLLFMLRLPVSASAATCTTCIHTADNSGDVGYVVNDE